MNKQMIDRIYLKKINVVKHEWLQEISKNNEHTISIVLDDNEIWLWFNSYDNEYIGITADGHLVVGDMNEDNKLDITIDQMDVSYVNWRFVDNVEWTH